MDRPLEAVDTTSALNVGVRPGSGERATLTPVADSSAGSPDMRDTTQVMPEQQEASYVEKALGLTLLLILAVGCIFVIKPFLHAILLAVTLCVSTWPLYRRMDRLLGGRRTPAALLMTLSTALLLMVPLVILGSQLADDIARLTTAIYAAIDRGLPPPPWLGRIPLIGAEAERVWRQISQHGAELGPTLAPYVRPIRDWALEQGVSLLSGTVQVLLAVILAFFLYRDGEYVEKRLEKAMARIGGWRARHVLNSAGSTITGVVNGVLGTALIQALLLGFSFWLVGVPGAAVLGALALVLTLVPFGLLVLWLPAALWLLSQDHTASAIFVVAWNGVFVGNLDNILRPYLISRGSRLPMVLIFLGVLGGVITFGIVGVFLGPILLAVAYTLVQDWERVSEAEVQAN